VKGSEAVATILKKEGVEYFFGFPINPVIDTAAMQDIRPLIARTERTVIGMADGYTRVNNGRKLGVCGTQWGPGVENSFGGMAQAFSDGTPILFMPAGPRQTRLYSEPVFDIVKNFQYVSKWSARVNHVQRISELMRRAFTFLRTGRPGPVLLELPQDVLAAEIDESDLDYDPVQGPRTMASPDVVREAVKAILAAERPFFHAGVGVLYAEAWDELRELAELVQAPVMTTLQSKSAFAEDHPLSVGSGGQAGSLQAARFLAESDLIFGVGSGLAISSYDAPIPKGKLAVQLIIDERDFNKDYKVAYPVMGDAKLVLQQMIEEVKRQIGEEGRKGDGKVAAEIESIRKEWMDQWMPKLTSNETPINPYRVLWEVQQAVDLRNTIATHDAGTPRDQMTPFWKALEPNSYVGWGKSTHLGYGIPVALGAKLARPEKTVVNIMGDLAFGMSGLDIETGVRNKLGTITIVYNNGLMGGYDVHLPNATKRYGARYISGNYTKIGEGLGAYAERVEKPDEIQPAIKRAIEQNIEGRPALIEIITREETSLSINWKK
jgi:uncharacterized protein